MPPKRIFTTQHVARLAKKALKLHGPGLTVLKLAQLTGLSPGTIQLRLGPWTTFKKSLGLDPQTYAPTHTKAAILTRLAELAQTNPRISLVRFSQLTGYSEKVIARRFGSWTDLKRELQLAKSSPGSPAVSSTILLADFMRVMHTLGRIPTVAQYECYGRFSFNTLNRRLGDWAGMPDHIRSLLDKLKELRPTPEGQAQALQILLDPNLELPPL